MRQQAMFREQNEAKLEQLNELLREGKVGPHKFDQEFTKLWSGSAGADDALHRGGFSRPRIVVVPNQSSSEAS